MGSDDDAEGFGVSKEARGKRKLAGRAREGGMVDHARYDLMVAMIVCGYWRELGLLGGSWVGME